MSDEMPQKNSTQNNASRNKSAWKKKMLAVGLSVVFALLLGEVAIRLIGETDEDGNFLLRGRFVGHRHPHVEWVKRINREYVEGTSKWMIYNPQTGWSPRPNAISPDGLYRYNSQGIRSTPSEYDEVPANDALRIALFGDSFTHGDDVPWKETWAAQLERNPTDRAALAGATGSLPASEAVRFATHPTASRVEILNFGVSAYGMDQAFLRWNSLGKKYKPKIVIFGFQPENIARNVNLLRGFYVAQTGIPFSKPRFIIDTNGQLKPINLPCVKPEDVPETMANMSEWEFAKHEYYYSPEKFRRRFWHFSRLLSLIANRAAGTSTAEKTARVKIDELDAEPSAVSLKIIAEFEREVEATGSDFFVLHLPRKQDIQKKLSGKNLSYEKFLTKLKQQHSFIDPMPAFLTQAKIHSLDELFVTDKKHYSQKGNQIVAEIIARQLKLQQKPQ